MQNEDNENNLSETVQESQQNQSQASQDSDKERRSMTANLKMIFFALIEAATRYREGYWREEVEDFKNDCVADAEAQVKKAEAEVPKQGYKKYIHTPAKEAKMVSKIKGLVLGKEQELVRFNDAMYKEIDKLKGVFNKDAETGFDNYATGMGLILEEYVKAKNTKEILMICSMYNLGKFDHVFKSLEEQPKTPEYAERTVADAQRDVVSEELNPDANCQNKTEGQEFKSSLILNK